MKKLLSSLFETFRDFIETVFLALALFVVVNTFIAQLHQVTGNSMLPDFHDGEYLVTDKVTYRFREPKRGEVIIFKAPEAPTRDYIKRVIGLPGESVELREGRVYIYNRSHPDGFTLNETYLRPKTLTEGKKFLPAGKRYIIPPENYLVFGDNREVSSDSRTWGTVTKEEIVGRSLVRLWPPSAFTFIARAEYSE